MCFAYCHLHIIWLMKRLCKGAAAVPPIPLHTPSLPVYYTYALWASGHRFSFFPPPFFSPISQKRLWFFGGNVVSSNCQGLLLLQRGLIMLSFSETFFLKTTHPIALISLLVYHVQKQDSEAHGHDCLICKRQPNVCKFLLVLEA